MPHTSLPLEDVGPDMEGRQLTLELFECLNEAARLPEEMSVIDLLDQLDITLDNVPVFEQMEVAGEALSQIASAFSERAALLLLDWEDRCRGPLVDGDWLDGLVNRSPTFELAAYESEPVRLPSPPRSSRKRDDRRVRYVTKTEILSSLDLQEPNTIEDIVALAQQEEIGAIERAIWEQLTSNPVMRLGDIVQAIGVSAKLLGLLAVLVSDRMQFKVVGDAFYVPIESIYISTAATVN